MAEERVTQGFEPEAPFRYFEEISAIPRGSGNEEKIALYVVEQARKRELYFRMDEAYNVMVKIQASTGMEDHDPVLLQAHMDMVCEKNASTAHDFETEGLCLKRDGRILTADGTTLGADDGKGVAYMLAIMEEAETFAHPEIELLFTTGEEVGFTGALAHDYFDMDSRRMIGLDAGPEGVVGTAAAGACTVLTEAPFKREKVEPYLTQRLCVTVSGLLGGHSAGCIDMGRANANQLLGEALSRLEEKMDLRLVYVDGGLKYNAIPREASATVRINSGCARLALDILSATEKALRSKFHDADPGLRVTGEVTWAKGPEDVIPESVGHDIIRVLRNAPIGVFTYNEEMKMPSLSNNLGVVRTEGQKVTFQHMIRSDTEALKKGLVQQIKDSAKPFPSVEGEWMCAWSYQKDSVFRRKLEDFYQQETGKAMTECATHGGLELGVFSERVPGMDIATLGCDSGDEHTVTEWMDLESFGRVYEFLKKFLEQL